MSTDLGKDEARAGDDIPRPRGGAHAAKTSRFRHRTGPWIMTPRPCPRCPAPVRAPPSRPQCQPKPRRTPKLRRTPGPGQADPPRARPSQARPSQARPSQADPARARPRQTAPGKPAPGKTAPGATAAARDVALSLLALGLVVTVIPLVVLQNRTPSRGWCRPGGRRGPRRGGEPATGVRPAPPAMAVAGSLAAMMVRWLWACRCCWRAW